MEGVKEMSKEVDIDSIARGDGEGDLVAIEYEEVKHVTDKAALFVIDGEKTWVPRSQIHSVTEESLEVSEWLAVEKGWA